MDTIQPAPPTRIYIGLGILTLTVFGQVIGFDFVNIDDPVYVDNYMVARGLTWEGLAWAFSNIHTNFSTTLNWISHMLDVELFGFNPAGHHLTSLLLHLLNTILFFLILNRITRDYWKSAIAAALFAVHPLRVENVAWIADRKDLLAMLFSLLTMLAYVNYARKRRPLWYAGTVACFILALLSKPVAVTLPCVLLLMDYWPLGRWRPAGEAAPDQPGLKTLLWEKVPLFGLSGLFSWIAQHGQAVHQVMITEEVLPWTVRFMNVPLNYLRYLEKIFWPVDLAVFYPLSYQAPEGWKVAASFIFLTAVTVWAVRYVKKAPYLLVGWLWFLGTLVPVVGFVKAGFHEIADRYTYFPLIGILLMGVWGLAAVVKRMNLPAQAAGGASLAVILVLTLLSVNQTRSWQNSVTLFQHAIDHTGRNGLAHLNLGHALMQQGELEKSIPQFKQVLEINPRDVLARLNLGTVYKRQGRTPEAIAAYQQVLQVEPNHVVVHFELGKLYHQVGDGPRAIHHTSIALEILIRQYGAEFEKTREAKENLALYRKVYAAQP